LISCENKLNEQPIDVWTASEKRKFATVRRTWFVQAAEY